MTVFNEAYLLEHCIEKADGAVLNGSDDLFIITGAPILVTMFVGIVTTVIGANVATCRIDHTTVEPAGTVALSTDVAITDDAVGVSYTFTAVNPSVFTPTDVGTLGVVPVIAWLCPIGTLKATCSAANTGNIKWYMVYKPLSPKSLVVVAP